MKKDFPFRPCSRSLSFQAQVLHRRPGSLRALHSSGICWSHSPSSADPRNNIWDELKWTKFNCLCAVFTLNAVPLLHNISTSFRDVVVLASLNTVLLCATFSISALCHMSCCFSPMHQSALFQSLMHCLISLLLSCCSTWLCCYTPQYFDSSCYCFILLSYITAYSTKCA